MKPIIEANNLKKYFGPIKAVDGVSFQINVGETFGLVGGSGSGKSTIAKLVVGILRPSSGDVTIHGDKDIIFQNPYGSLNPRMTIKAIVEEPLLVRGVRKSERENRVRDTLIKVKLDPATSMQKYPYHFSGGERQRIAIARALIHRPKIIVLDEPVSNLDVLIQAEILNLLKDLQEEFSLSYLFISHDLRVVEFMADFIGIMGNGRLLQVLNAVDFKAKIW